MVIRGLWHPPGGGWCHIQGKLRGNNWGTQGSFSQVGVQSPSMGCFSPCHSLTLGSCLLLSVFLKQVWFPHGPAPPFPALTTASSVLSYLPVPLTQNASPFLGPFPSMGPSHHSRPRPLDCCYSYQYCNVQTSSNILCSFICVHLICSGG